MLEPSRHNIIGQIADSDQYYIINPLSRQADIMDGGTAEKFLSGDYDDLEELAQKGYLTEPEEEQRRYRAAYLDFIDDRDTDEIQIFYVPSYACNFSCSYCYQDGYEHRSGVMSEDVADAFFSYIEREFAGRRYYVTVFGGEPLMPSASGKEHIRYLVNQAAERNIPLAFVTNGYTLADYIPILSGATIREIQVTLDGVGAVHDQRRMLHDGSATFGKISEGIDAALSAGLPVNLRSVVDRDTLSHLIELADHAIERGWTASPLFKTQLGRNYELHVCQSDQNRLYDRLSMYQELYEMIKGHPRFLEYHQPAYSLSKFIFEHGQMPEPLFDACPACKTEWAFDYTGNIFSCTATVGKQEEKLGTFYPEVSKTEEMIDAWQERDVSCIPECRECSLQLACGGGCGSVAKNTTGSVLSPDCRPVRELMGLGIALYSSDDQTEEERR